MAIKDSEVRELIDFAPQGFLVTSFYLDVNAREFPSPDHIQKSFDSLQHTADARLEEISTDLSHEARESVRTDLAQIQEFVEKKFERVDTQGLAIFSCAAQGFWEIFQLPNPVPNQVYFQARPYLPPLAAFLSHSKPTAILLTDRQQARIFTMKHGAIREWTAFEDYVPTRSDQGGWSQMRYQRRSDHWAKHHVDKAAELVLKLEQHYPFDWLIIGGEPEIDQVLQQDLHPYLKDCVIGTINVRIDAPEADVIAAARKVREEKEDHLIDDLMHRVQEYAGAGGRGTIGLADTIQAMNEQKVHILLVQQGYSVPGSVCNACDQLYPKVIETCPACGGSAERVENVAAALIQKGMELGARVEVATEFNQLEPIGCVGSIMYY